MVVRSRLSARFEGIERLAQASVVRVLISHSGNRTSGDITRARPSAVFTGTGFGSMNKSLNTATFDVRCLAPILNRLIGSRTSAHTSDGNKFDATLTTAHSANGHKRERE